MNITTIYFKKNSNQLDMRFKSNREFAKSIAHSKFWEFMQALAIKLGSPGTMGGHIRWELWLNPFWHINQWYLARKTIQFGSCYSGVDKDFWKKECKKERKKK